MAISKMDPTPIVCSLVLNNNNFYAIFDKFYFARRISTKLIIPLGIFPNYKGTNTLMKLLSALFILDNMLMLVFLFNTFMHNVEK